MRSACVALAAVVLVALTPRTSRSQEAPRAYWLIVTGLSGEPEYAASYTTWARTIADAAKTRFGAADVTWLAEKGGGGTAGVSTKANVEAALTRIAADATPADAHCSSC